jgi:hypothetical protein
MYIDYNNNQLTVIVPRGINIGRTILKELKENNIAHTTFKTIKVVRDIKTKTNVVTLKTNKPINL